MFSHSFKIPNYFYFITLEGIFYLRKFAVFEVVGQKI